jgi:putative restriction endonuclease
MKRNSWTLEELQIVFNLYVKLGFTKIRYTKPEVINIARLLNRSPSAVALKLVNLARFDPDLQRRGVKGMGHGSKQDHEIWQEYVMNPEDFLIEGERLIALRENQTLEQKYSNDIPDFSKYSTSDQLGQVKIRICQKIFRSMILSIYKHKCAITGLNIDSLLVASHIIPWSVNENERLNPRNGICLNSLYDDAFDKGLIGITPKYTLILSQKLKSSSTDAFFQQFFHPYEKVHIQFPKVYPPSKDFLQFHLDEIFIK